MLSRLLMNARRYEAEAAENITPSERPGFHLTPYAGWMNDPNGFCFYKGQYHMFYQYHPFKSKWDTMYWGHAASHDLLHWEHLPAALAPDMHYDQDGCFSGSAIGLPDGRLLLMYTGVRKEETPQGFWRDIQTQCLAVGDGIDFEKYEGNPVLDANSLPAGGSREDFRDPKIIVNSDGSYSALIGNRPADGSGQILMYRSNDGYRWRYAATLLENENRFGRMWECPDFFELDGKWVLLTSPQDMLPDGLEYHNGNGTLAFIGDYDEAGCSYVPEHDQSIDYGIDFYAPQTILAPDGRRIMIAWMQNWDAVMIREPGAPWAGQMSVPRELFIRDGRLCQRPIHELEMMRRNRVAYRDVEVGKGTRLEGVRGRTVDMELTIRPADVEKLYTKFEMKVAENDQFYTSIRFRPREGTLKIDREFSGSRRAIVHQRSCKIDDPTQPLKLRVIVDRFSVELFINDGVKTMTAALYTDPAAEGISFNADGDVRMDIIKYDLVV